MNTQIPYKALTKPLKMIFKSEITERKEEDYQSSVKLTYVDIIPEKLSFWSGEQCIQVIREAAPVNSLPGNQADAFVQQVSQVLNQLVFKIGFKGMPVLLEKQDVLWKKWLSLRELLADTYTGDWVQEMLTRVDLKMIPSDKLLPMVMSDLFLNDYFRNVYEMKFDSGVSHSQQVVYGLVPVAVKLNEVWELQTSDQHFNLKFSGKCVDSDVEQNLGEWIKSKMGNEPVLKPEIISAGSFRISKETGWCSSFQSTYSFATESGFEKVMKITLTSI